MRAHNVLAGLALVAALTGCSDDGTDEPDASESTSPTASATTAEPSVAAEPAEAPEDELEAAYRTYVDAFLTGDGATAYALLSQRCQDLEPLSEFAAVSEQAAEVYGLVDYEIRSVSIAGDRGKLDADYAVEALNQGGGSEWVLEGGEWRSDKCD